MRADRQIDYVELPAADLAAAESFYSAVFGWRFEDYGPEANLKASVANGSALVMLYAEDLESALRLVTEHGGTVVRDIFSFPGGRRFHFVDPNGNELAVGSYR